MDIFNVASALFGSSRVEETDGISNAVDSISAVGAIDSDSGNVGLTMDADITPADETDGDETIFEVPTSPAVAAGDDVVMGLTGNGPLKVPIVIANPGSGDRMAAAVQDAHDLAASVESIAQEAKEVAEATGQHFWPDEDGVHVTEVTQDEWSDSTSTDYHSGANVLLNALGQLFRDGVNNILAIVSGTDPGVAIYDGEGNTADNVVASFTGDSVTIGKPSGLNSLFNNVGIYFRNAAANLLTLTTGETYQKEASVATGTSVRLDNYPGAITSVTLDGVETSGYTTLGAYVTITESFTGTKTCVVTYRSSPYLSMYAGDSTSNDLIAQFAANAVKLAKGAFNISTTTSMVGSDPVWHGTLGLNASDARFGDMRLGVNTAGSGSSYVTLSAGYDGEVGSLVIYSDRTLDFNYLDNFDFADGTVTTGQAYTTFDQRWRTLGTAGSGGRTFTLPHAGTWLLVTGHNSTAGANGIWVLRTGGNNAFKMGGGSNITVTLSGTSLTVKSSSGTVAVYASYIGN